MALNKILATIFLLYALGFVTDISLYSLPLYMHIISFAAAVGLWKMKAWGFVVALVVSLSQVYSLLTSGLLYGFIRYFSNKLDIFLYAFIDSVIAQLLYGIAEVGSILIVLSIPLILKSVFLKSKTSSA